MASQILIVEDDERIRTSMRLALEDEGYEVTEAPSGEQALEVYMGSVVGQGLDVVIIDIMLPGMDGFDCCREIRRQSGVPIIMVTARTDTHDVVAGLEAGADDYITKPFEPKELAARIRALLRRARATDNVPSTLTFANLEILPEAGVVRLSGEPVHLTRTEFLLLCELASNAGKVLSREQLLERVWSYDYFGDGRLVDVHVRRLRLKIEQDPANPRHVLTVRGLGYKPRREMSDVPDAPVRRIHRPRFRKLHLQLRARISMAFALGALVMFAGAATAVFFVSRSTIINQAVSADLTSALANASSLQGITPAGNDVLALLTSFDRNGESLSLYKHSGIWIDGSPYFPSACHSMYFKDLPTSLVSIVDSGGSGIQRFTFDHSTYLAVGYSVNDGDSFYQVFITSSVDTTINDLLLTLLLVTIATTLLAGILGFWASRQTLRPLRDAARAATEIARGRLDTRLKTDEASDLAELASAFNQMVDGVQERIERETRFASDVAHELRSPLTTLATALSVIESRRDELPERGQQALELLSAEIQRFQRMVFDLLEISRLDAGAANLTPSIVTVGELVRNALASAGATDIPLVIDEQSEHAFLYVDKRRFERIMANLVSNAFRHAGGATAVIVSSDDKVVRIAVEDAGPGVAQEDRERIFGRFARGTTTAGSRGSGAGTGLGLALVAEHVRLHQGRVWIEDATPRGSRFVVELPLAPDYLVSDPDLEVSV